MTAGQRRLDQSGAILEAALATTDLGRRYRRGSPWALKHLSVDIPRGTITALVGPNGAGKSTLIRCWLGFERPDQGSAYVSGIEVRANPQAALERIGYVSQSNSLYGDLSIADHFRLAATYRRRFDLSNATGHVSRLGLDTDRKLAELSGGEQAQVALALALSVKADVLLLDEPLASLDPLARREFLNTLKASVRESGSTALAPPSMNRIDGNLTMRTQPLFIQLSGGVDESRKPNAGPWPGSDRRWHSVDVHGLLALAQIDRR